MMSMLGVGRGAGMMGQRLVLWLRLIIHRLRQVLGRRLTIEAPVLVVLRW